MKHRVAAFLATAVAFASCIAPLPLEARTHTGSCTSSYYLNVSGHCRHRPIFSPHQHLSGSSAHCRDGSESFSEHHRGTCSHHGGVAFWQ